MKRTILLSMSVLAALSFPASSGDIPPTLFSTKWQLEGFFSAKANKLEKPDYSNSNINSAASVPPSPDSGVIGDRYTLEFAPDSAVRHEDREYRVCRGNLARLSFWGLYTADYARSAIEFEVVIRPTAADTEDGERYDRSLYLSRKFELRDTDLKLYYGDEGDYLLFGLHKESDTSYGAAEAVPEVLLAGNNLTAGPNPVERSAGRVNFYREGKPVSSGTLKVFDTSGKLVGKVKISDAAGGLLRRQVGSWDLRDRKGKSVSEGTYLVSGKIRALDGKTEKVSLVLGVR